VEETAEYCLLEKAPLDSTSLIAEKAKFKHVKSGRASEGYWLET